MFISKARKLKLGLSVLAIALIPVLITISNRQPKEPSIGTEDIPSEFNCGLENNQLYVEPVTLRTKFIDYCTHTKLDIDRENIISIDNYNDFTLVIYKNNNNNNLEEVLISSELPERINKSKSTASKIKGYSIINDKAAKFAQAFKDMPIGHLSYSISNSNISDDEVVNRISSIEKGIIYSKNTLDDNIVLNIDGIGTLNLNNISVFKDACGMYYGKDNILRLYNYFNDTAYIWIANINNAIMMNPIGNLKATEYNNIYADKDVDNKEKIGYRTYAIMTDNGLYSVKFNEQAPEGLEEEFFKALGLSKEDEKIEIDFKLNGETTEKQEETTEEQEETTEK